jgi:hypothetical protein
MVENLRVRLSLEPRVDGMNSLMLMQAQGVDKRTGKVLVEKEPVHLGDGADTPATDLLGRIGEAGVNVLLGDAVLP